MHFPTFFKRINKWWHLGLAILLSALANFIIFIRLRQFEELTQGTPMIEVPRMIRENLYEVANTYPAEALTIYQTQLQPLDILLPIFSGALFTVALAVFSTRVFPENSRWRYLPVLGLLVTLFDWTHNLTVFFILRTLDTPVAWLELLSRGVLAVGVAVAYSTLISVVTLFLLYLIRLLRGGRKPSI
ncbi:MAG: hypothetical protein AAF738_11565 [Bacteroidota bacterium]